MIFLQIFSNNGLLNSLFTRWGWITEPIPFLTKAAYARLVIVLTMLWRWTGYNMVFYLAGLQNIDSQIYEAARIDGLGEFRIFLKMFVPVMRPTYAAAAIVTFMNAWNSYLWPLVILQDPAQITLPIYAGSFRGGYVLDYGAIMLVVTISTIPMLVIFFTLQKSFVQGILGSVK